MTYFTRIMIDTRMRRTRWVMLSLERLHAIVARSVDPIHQGCGRMLWRLDEGRNGRISRLYIVSDTVPDARILCAELDVLSKNIATCEYEPFLDKLAIGQEWGFRLKANPTKSCPSPDFSTRGKRVGIVKVEDQLEWLYEKARKAGFHMPINRLEIPEVMVRDSRKVDFSRQGSTVTLSSVVYDGVLAIDDVDLFKQALLQGIGRAKGYGFGLLTLVPLTRESR